MVLDTICEKTGKPCRFCSLDRSQTVSRMTVIKTGQIERRETWIPMGQWCNNDGKHFVRDLRSCPVPDALAVPLGPLEVNELDWSRRRGGC